MAETENLRQELVSSRERSEQAEAAVRASEQRAREGADKKTKDLLAEMETLCQDKLLAENRAIEMEGDLDRLREEVAGAEQTAARDQSMIIRASEERMAVLEQVRRHILYPFGLALFLGRGPKISLVLNGIVCAVVRRG